MQSRSECSRLSKGCLSSKSQEYTSSGISSLDAILNGGFPLGAVVLIEEDELRAYSELFVNYFLAEGVANNDHIFLASKDSNPQDIVKELPPAINKREEIQENTLEELKIAWRYQENKPIQSSPGGVRNTFSHDFDFSSKLTENAFKSTSLTFWPENFACTNFHSLFNKIFEDISTKGLWFGHEKKNIDKKILRICIPSLGSPFWFDEDVPIYQMLLKLRTAVHNSSSVALVTIPTGLLDPKVVFRCEQISDIVLSLNSLANNTNKQYSEYSGLLKFLKISPINSLSIHVPDDSDWAFKVKKKKLIIEKLHLPPESSITTQMEGDGFAKASKPNCQFQF